MSDKLQIPGGEVHPQGVFTLTHVRDGKLLAHQRAKNTLTYAGKNMILNGIFKPDHQIPALYFGMAMQTPTNVADNFGFYEFRLEDTPADHPGWAEFTGYVVAESRHILGDFNYNLNPIVDLSIHPFGNDPVVKAHYDAAKHTNRERFLGIPHPIVGQGGIISHLTYVGAANQDFVVIVPGWSGVWVYTDPLDYATRDPSGVVMSNPLYFPLFQITSPGTIIGVFLATTPTWNDTAGEIFAFRYFDVGTLAIGDFVQFEYHLGLEGTNWYTNPEDETE
jgi:hypothetical protein